MSVSHAATVAGRDVAWLIADRAERWPDRACIRWVPFEGPAETFTYAEVRSEVWRLAAGLQQAGIRPRDRILIHMNNSPAAIFAWFASAIVGSIAVTTNTGATRSELAHFIGRSEPRLALIDAEFAPLFDKAPGIERVYVHGMRDGEVRHAHHRFEDLRHDGAVSERPRDPLQPLSIQFTSGSTSMPKAVLWTHGNALWGAQVSALHQRLVPDDVYLCCLPFFHTNAQTYMILPTLWSGGTIVLQPRFSASRFWPVATNYGCTRASLVPFCLRALWDRLPVPPHSFKSWGLGVAHPEASARFGVEILGWWGMTETISQCIVSDGSSAHAYLSMGRVSPAYEIALRKADGSLAGVGEIGQIFVRGERGVSLFREYYGDDAATEAAFDREGWFATGDLAYRDAKGDLFFDSRMSDLIKCGGENVSPRELESVLMTVPGVREAAVVGRRDRLYGEVPVAFIIGDDRDAALAERAIAQCRSKLASFKMPRDVIVVSEFPRAALNKIAKGELRSRLELAAEAQP